MSREVIQEANKHDLLNNLSERWRHSVIFRVFRDYLNLKYADLLDQLRNYEFDYEWDKPIFKKYRRELASARTNLRSLQLKSAELSEDEKKSFGRGFKIEMDTAIDAVTEAKRSVRSALSDLRVKKKRIGRLKEQLKSEYGANF